MSITHSSVLFQEPTLCIAGKNDIAVEAVEFLLHTLSYNPQKLWILPNHTDIGQDSWQRSLKKCALIHRLHITTLEELYSTQDLCFISLEFDRIIQPKKFFSKRLFNIHFSLLPAFKGMYTSVMPFLANVSHTGVTLHYIDNGIDTGPILQQISFPITLEDTARSLYFKYNQYALSLFKKNIINLLNNTLQSYPQPAEGSTYFSKHVIDFKHITIDLNKTSYEIHNQLRAFIFPEYQLPQLSGQYISHTILTQQQIGYNYYEQNKNSIILSGIDGYKIITTVDPTYQKQK